MIGRLVFEVWNFVLQTRRIAFAASEKFGGELQGFAQLLSAAIDRRLDVNAPLAVRIEPGGTYRELRAVQGDRWPGLILALGKGAHEHALFRPGSRDDHDRSLPCWDRHGTSKPLVDDTDTRHV